MESYKGYVTYGICISLRAQLCSNTSFTLWPIKKMVFSQEMEIQKKTYWVFSLKPSQDRMSVPREMWSITNLQPVCSTSAWIKQQTNENSEKVYYEKLQVLSYSVYSWEKENMKTKIFVGWENCLLPIFDLSVQSCLALCFAAQIFLAMVPSVLY